MSKGSKQRRTNQELFNKNFNNIKWGASSDKFMRHQKPKPRAYHIIFDIDPYKAVGGDMAGKYITSRSKHREFLKRNDFQEVGNEAKYFFKHDGKNEYNPTIGWEKG